MGTRNLTVVKLDGEYKIAQYGQWDGYPEGQGIKCLNFFRNLYSDKRFREEFEQKLRLCRFASDEELERDFYTKKNWWNIYPELTRDVGADVLNIVSNCENGLVLYNSIDFAADSLFCEYAWVIDLDENKFEGYTGFNEKPLSEDDRFYFLHEKEERGYHGVKLCAKWDIESLPSDIQFYEAFKEEE